MTRRYSTAAHRRPGAEHDLRIFERLAAHALSLTLGEGETRAMDFRFSTGRAELASPTSRDQDHHGFFLQRRRLPRGIASRARRAVRESMSEEEANQAVRDVLDLWQPDWSGDQGEALRLHQRVFARTRPRPFEDALRRSARR